MRRGRCGSREEEGEEEVMVIRGKENHETAERRERRQRKAAQLRRR